MHRQLLHYSIFILIKKHVLQSNETLDQKLLAIINFCTLNKQSLLPERIVVPVGNRVLVVGTYVGVDVERELLEVTPTGVGNF